MCVAAAAETVVYIDGVYFILSGIPVVNTTGEFQDQNQERLVKAGGRIPPFCYRFCLIVGHFHKHTE